MNTLLQDMRYGVRMLAKNPSFTAVAVLTLALGIGANTAIFSFIDAVLNLHFPIKDQGRIVNLWGFNKSTGAARNSLSIPDFLDYRQQNQVFEDLAASSGQTFHLTGVTEPKSIGADRVSFNYFHVLGVQPAMGRDFLPEESQAGRIQVVILSHGLWQGSFGADPAILGRSITLNRESYTVIGVMPAGFSLLTAGSSDLWVPLDLGSSALSRGVRQVSVIGRLKSGVGKEQAQAEMYDLAHRLAQAFPSTNKGWEVQVVRLQDEINKRLELVGVFIIGPVALVLLIACANVANLLLARASVREKEMSVRAAMGAGRLRLVRQLLTESTLLALLAGAFGLLLGAWGMRVLRSMFPIAMSSSPGGLHMDSRVLGYSLLICLLTPLLFGLAPALYASKLDLNETLKEGSRGSRAVGGSHRLREYLVVAQVGLAVALLGLGGMFIRMMLFVADLKPAFDVKNLLTMTISLPQSAYPHDSDLAAFYRRVVENARTIPGAESVGAVNRLAIPVEYRTALQPVRLKGGSGGELGASAVVLKVSPGYFSALRIPLRRGRELTDHDASGAARVALVNETLGRSWRGEDPIGKTLRWGGLGPDQPWVTVVGVVGDAVIDFHEAPMPGVYVPYAQNPERTMTFVLRTLTPPLGLEEPLKRALWAVDKDQPIDEVQTVEQMMSQEFAGQYATVGLIVAFAVLALVMASAGVYSVMSYTVAQRTHEIGVRMSLGARPRDVVQLVVKEAAALILSGLVVGLCGAFAFGRLLGHELTQFGITPYDPVTFSCVSVLLMTIALLACYLPTRRAMKVDPMVALRYE
jgi:putative ABC transport system permease protein